VSVAKDEETMRGQITHFERKTAGSVLVADAALDATVLTVADTADFEVGSRIVVGSLYVYEVTSVDNDTDTLTIDPALTASSTEGETVAVTDPETGYMGAVPRIAYGYEVSVLPDDADPTDRPITADASEGLARVLEEGARGGVGESVELRRDGQYGWMAYLLNEATGAGYFDNVEVGFSLNVGTDLTAQSLEVSDNVTVSTFGPTGAMGNPGFAFTNVSTGKTGWLLFDPAYQAFILQADITDADTQVTIGSIGTGADFTVLGSAYFGARLDCVGQVHGDRVYVDSQPTTAGAANVNMNGSGELQKSTSSRRYKKNIEDAAIDLDAVLALRTRSWVSKNSEDGPGRYFGFIAEEVDELGLTELVVYDNEGLPDGFAYPTLVTHLTALAQRQQAQIDDLTARLNALEAP